MKIEILFSMKKKGSVAFLDGFAVAHDDRDEFKRIDFYHALGWIDRCFLGKKKKKKGKERQRLFVMENVCLQL